MHRHDQGIEGDAVHLLAVARSGDDACNMCSVALLIPVHAGQQGATFRRRHIGNLAQIEIVAVIRG